MTDGGASIVLGSLYAIDVVAEDALTAVQLGCVCDGGREWTSGDDHRSSSVSAVGRLQETTCSAPSEREQKHQRYR